MARKKFRSVVAEQGLRPIDPSGKNDWLPALILAALTALAYSRVLRLGFIWDDDSYLTLNPTLRSAQGLWRIWTQVRATPQYYPLVHTSFWFEYHLWGLNPLGYHILNLVLHVGGSLLLWRILLRLRVPGAWFGAALFALHPIQVESVAWVTERKNVLCGVFYFASALTYLRWVSNTEHDKEKKDRPLLYFGSLGLFTCALLSKTIACTLPVALLAMQWWQRAGRLRRQDVIRLIPFIVIGAPLGLVTAWLERHHVQAEGAAWALSFPQRILISGRALCFYASKLIWPAKLTFIYPRWDVISTSAQQWIFPLGVAAVLLGLWTARGKLGRGPVTGVFIFILTLFPALGFFNIYPFRYSFVADHFQYLASAGLFALAGAGLCRLPRAIPITVLLVLAFFTWRQTAIYENLESLWRDTINKNPGSWMAQNSLGMLLAQTGKPNESLPYLRRALELEPDVVETQNGYGYALLKLGHVDDAFPYLRKAAEIGADSAPARFNLGDALLRCGRSSEATTELERAIEHDPTSVSAYSLLGFALLINGRAAESVAVLEKGLTLDPHFASIHLNLANSLLQLGKTKEAMAHIETVLADNPMDGEAKKSLAWILSTCPDERLRDGQRAVRLAESASRSTEKNDPTVEATLAAAYAEAGRFPEAVETAENARQVASASHAASLPLIDRELSLFRSGLPFRDNR